MNQVNVNKNQIAFKKQKVLTPPKSTRNGDSISLVATIQAELMNLGFMLSPKACEAYFKADEKFLEKFYQDVIPYARKLLGASKKYHPLYAGFPQEVMEKSLSELYINAFIHYASGGHWVPPQELGARRAQLERTSFTQLELITEAQFTGLFTQLVSINSSLTDDDKMVVEWFIKNHREKLVMPKSVPFKETLCMLAGHQLAVPVKTPTDVLRIAVYMSGGDISLPSVPAAASTNRPTPWWVAAQQQLAATTRDQFKFKKFTRAERKHILSLLEQTHASPSELQVHVERWKRLGELLHPGEYAQRFPKAAEAFQRIRDQDPKVRTFNGQVDILMKGKTTGTNWRAGIQLLSTRPGEFARKFDALLRKAEKKTDVAYLLKCFESIASGISSKVLFELRGHFLRRDKAVTNRSIVIKGRRAKLVALPDLPALSPMLIKEVVGVIDDTIQQKIADSNLSPLGSTWIDPALKNVPVPAGMRSINTSVKTFVRGTRVPLPGGAKTIRSFVHWTDKNGSQDIDLSAKFFSEDLTPKGHVSFTSLHYGDYGRGSDSAVSVHSGDVRHRRGSCAEYIDINVAPALRRGIRYVVIQIHNYNMKPFFELDDCVAGVMVRQHAKSNEIFEPKTVANAMTISTENPTVYAFIVDLQDNVYIWADVEANSGFATLESTRSQTETSLRSMIAPIKLSVYDLALMHVEARGKLAKSEDKAKTKFTWEEMSTNYAKVAELMTL